MKIMNLEYKVQDDDSEEIDEKKLNDEDKLRG